MKFLLVFIGGGVGSLLRLSVIEIFNFFSIKQTFLATLTSNILSGFVLGLLLGLELKNGFSDNAKAIFIIGICGGFSTFSTFGAETLNMLQTGQYINLLTYLSISIVFCWIAILIGMKII